MRDIDTFYASDVGKGVRTEAGRLLRYLVRPDPGQGAGQNVLLLGRADVFESHLARQLQNAERLIALTQEPDCPATGWNGAAGNRLCVGDYEDMPLPDDLFDLIIVVHALEHVGDPARFLREVWRVARAEARIVFLTPSRRGFWSRTDKTPFGHGHPYSRTQLERQLSDAMFATGVCERALFAPPFAYGIGPRTAAAMEILGAAFWPRFSGLLAIEAQKQIYGGNQVGEKELKLSPMATAPPA